MNKNLGFTLSLSQVQTGMSQIIFIIQFLTMISNKRQLERSEGKHSCTSTENQSSQQREEDISLVYQKKTRQKKDAKKFKTELCKNFSEKGYCPYGKKCRFAHGHRQLVRVSVAECFRTKRCNSFWEHGFCQYGVRCQFSHEEVQWEMKPVLLGISSLLETTPREVQITPGKLLKLLSN